MRLGTRIGIGILILGPCATENPCGAQMASGAAPPPSRTLSKRATPVPDEFSKWYLRPGLKLPEASYPGTMNPPPIRASEAARHAVAALKRRGVEQIRICALTWIAAGVGGALFDAIGRLDSGGACYSIFRVGVRDGTEAEKGRHEAGEEFVFIARGADRSGRIVWLPPPGPDYDPALHEFIGEYEYLDRESFEKLESTCR